MSVALVDYGLGNPGSVANMLKRLGQACRLVTTPEEILQSERVLLPGVGAFDAAVTKLREAGLIEALQDYGCSGRPLLGICLGMQLLFDSSEEGSLPGLGLLPGTSVRFREESGIRVPHMGWNTIEPVREDPLLNDLPPQSRFYFVHSYHVVPSDKNHVLAKTEYGERFVSMVRSGGIMGAQFHPEKSHVFGMGLLRNFTAVTA